MPVDDPGMALGTPLVVGVSMLVAMVVVQSMAIAAIGRLLQRELRTRATTYWARNVGLGIEAMLLILVSQLVQITAWAVLYTVCGEFGDFAVAFFHSAMSFTALDDGGLMSARWRLLAPLEAVGGMLMLGLSAAVLFSVVQRLMHLRVGRRVL